MIPRKRSASCHASGEWRTLRKGEEQPSIAGRLKSPSRPAIEGRLETLERDVLHVPAVDVQVLPYRVARTRAREERDGMNIKIPQVMDVLDGDFDQFMHAFLRLKAAKANKQKK